MVWPISHSDWLTTSWYWIMTWRSSFFCLQTKGIFLEFPKLIQLMSYSLFIKLSCLRASTGLNVCAWLWISSPSRGVTTLIAYSLQPVPFKVTGWSVMFPRSIFLGPFSQGPYIHHSLSGLNFFTWLFHEPLSGQFISASSIDWHPFGFIGLQRNLLH
jgi:hypothetical protein